MEECIQALVAEAMRLRTAISHAPKPGDIVAITPLARAAAKPDVAGS